MTAATLDSTAATTEICRGVAPTRRIAANRCSRRVGGQPGRRADEDEHREQERAGDDGQDQVMPLASKPKDAQPPVQSPGDVAVEMLVTSSASGTRASSSPAGRPTDDEQGVGRGQRGGADGADLLAAEPARRARRPGSVASRRPGRRGVELARPGQPRDARRHRGVGSGGGDVDPADGLAVVVVSAEQPPQRVRSTPRPRRRRCLGGAGLEPARSGRSARRPR